MNWDFVLPGVTITDTVQASEPVMNSERFAAFYERSARPLWAYLARVSGDPSLADDLMQESYVRFLCALPLRRRSRIAALSLPHRQQSPATIIGDVPAPLPSTTSPKTSSSPTYPTG